METVGRLALSLLIAIAACGRMGFDDNPPIVGDGTKGDGASVTDGGGDGMSPDGGPSDGMMPDGSSAMAVAFVGSPIQHTGPKSSMDSVAFQATNAGDAITIMVACAASQVPSTVALSAPGWTFFQLAPITVNSGGQVYGAAYGAIAPNTASATLTITWTNSTCNRGQSILADEFTNNDQTGNSITFDATSANSGAGNCTTSLTTAHAGDAVWAACYAATALTGVGAGYTKSAADTVGDFAEYKLTADPANTVEAVTFMNPNGYVVVAATIKPI